MKLIAEVGSNWIPNEFPLEDAIKAAFDCGADLVKIQFWISGKRMAMRRGMAKGLEQWQLPAKTVFDLICNYQPKLGFSVFFPEDVQALEHHRVNSVPIPAAFIKTASQEWQCARLAEAVSQFSCSQDVPLYVSVPGDAPLVVGNYFSSQPITWLYCEPRYPVEWWRYQTGEIMGARRQPNRIADMAAVLPGKVGFSDHTVDDLLLKNILEDPGHAKVSCLEKHFCYHEALRDKCLDGGPWSLGQQDFRKLAEIVQQTVDLEPSSG